jgi:hypothetical protein
MLLYVKLPYRLLAVMIIVWLSVILSFTDSLYGQQNSEPNFHFASGQSALKIPFELYNNLIFIRTRVNNSSPLWFLLDTGAEISVIKQSRAQSLGLQFEGKGQTEASGGAAQFLNVKGVTLSLPGADVLNPTVVAMPLESLEPLLGREADGILGADLFNRFVVEIDYANQIVNLFDPQSYRYSGRGEALPIIVKENIPYLHALITQTNLGMAEGVFQLDTGSDSTVVLNTPFAKAHKFIGATKTIEAGGRGAGGETRSLIGRVEKIALGRFVMGKPLVRFSQDEKGELAIADFAGLIGGELLRRFRVILDYANGRIILEPNAHLSEPDEFNMSGASFVFDAPNFKVLKVDKIREGSPAAEAGLAVGDVVTALDGQSVAKFNSAQLRQLWRQNKRTYLLEIKRGEKMMRTKITMRRII